MGACFHINGVQCDNCRTGLAQYSFTTQPYTPEPVLSVPRSLYEELLAELNTHKANAAAATQLLVEARKDFVLVADALGLVSTDDTGRIGAVASVEEVVAEAKQAAAALARQPELFESMRMSCEEPPSKCECAGCMYSREKSGAHNE